MGAIGLVAAVELDCGPADFGQDVGQRAAAVAAAPAIDQRLPVARLVGKLRLQVARDVVRDQGGAHFLCFEGIDLLVERADPHPLLVVQHRAVDGAGQVVEGELALAAHVDDGVEMVQLGEDLGEAQDSGVFHREVIKVEKVGQMLFRMMGWACAFGCRRSDWNSAGLSATPSSMNGTSGDLVCFDRVVNMPKKRSV